MTAERRASPRFAVDMEALIEGEQGLTLDGRTIDISRNGICLLTAAAIPAGSQVRLRLRLLMEGIDVDALELSARVVWCTASEGEFQLGASFEPLEDDGRSLEVLLGFLSGELQVPGTA